MSCVLILLSYTKIYNVSKAVMKIPLKQLIIYVVRTAISVVRGVIITLRLIVKNVLQDIRVFKIIAFQTVNQINF